MGRRGIVERLIRYEALPSQKRFHESPARFKGFSGPIGSGKSQALCHEAIRLTYLNPGRMGLVGAPTYPMLRDSTQAALFEILERNKIPFEHNKAENVLTMGDTRSRVVFRAVDDYERLRGTNLAWFGVDELTYAPEAAWLRLEGRLRDPRAARLCGFAVWTPKGYDWVYRRFVAERVEGYETVLAQAFENRHLLEKVPDFYERLKSSYDENLYRQEVMGQYLTLLGGLVYTAFDRAAHVTDVAAVPGTPLLWALDFNVDPMASVVAQVVGGTVHVLDEIVLRHASTQEACEEFQRRFPRHPQGLVVYGDASGHQRQTTGDTDWETIREHFAMHSGAPVTFRNPRSNPLVRERVALVNTKLRNAAGQAQLLVDRKCKELIQDFEQVTYKADSNAIDKDRDRRRTHVSDALGYLLWQECRPLPEIGERGTRVI
jgi:phage terminase large subunit